MFESRRLDLDRMAKNSLDLDLIVAVDSGSGGHGRLGARAAALGRRSSAPAAALRRRRQSRPFRGGFERGLGREAPTRHAQTTRGNGTADWGLVGPWQGEGRRWALGLAGERAFALCWDQAGAGKRLRACAEPKQGTCAAV